MRGRARSSGFTLIELMVTVVVLAIIATLAFPSFADAIDRARIKSQVTRVVDVIEFGKSEALKHNTWGSSARINVVAGSAWAVKTDILDSGGTVLETKTTDPQDVRGVTLIVPVSDQSLTLNFRGILSGYVGDTSISPDPSANPKYITLQSARGRQVTIMANPIGNILVCAVGAAFGEYPQC